MTVADTIEEQNKETIRTYHHRLWGSGDKSAIDEYWSPDAEVHMTDFDGTAVDVVREDVDRYFAAFEGQTTTIHQLIAEGDRVALHWSTTGRHVAPYGEVPATNKEITMAGIDLLRLKDGKIVECWSMWDGLSVFDQMGVLQIG
jgi:predicted ester cyclase